MRIGELGARLWQEHGHELPADVRREAALHIRHGAPAIVAMDIVKHCHESLSSDERLHVLKVLDEGDFRRATPYFRELLNARE